jgi:L-alanine-DL-glutamate epimerase-like enolase superfamily enzyme
VKTSIEPLNLSLRHPFGISRGVATTSHNAVLRVEDQGIEGLGEAAPARHYGETQASVERALAIMTQALPDDLTYLEPLLRSGDTAIGRSGAAKAALDLALHDLVAKRLGLPVHQLLGLPAPEGKMTSFTIGLDSPEVVRRKVLEAREYPILKVKVGVPGDLELVALVRELSDAQLRVDANAGWSFAEARRKIPRLVDLGVELIEQPLPPSHLEGIRTLRDSCPVPIFADESVERAEDIPRIAGCVDGINIKLMKCGGLREAMRMIAVARAHHLQIMLGCMVESSLAITAAAHLASLVDYLDLDGHLLVSNDPFVGVGVDRGVMCLPEGIGLGVRPKPPGGEEEP